MNISDRIEELKRKINKPEVTVIAVSKTQAVEKIIELYNAGHKVFGENKVQELVSKFEQLKDYDIEWHMIGHLQRNKVKYIAPFVSMIHSVDKLKLLKEIDKQAKKNNRTINCLLQFHIAKEDTKFGFDYDECLQMLETEDFKQLNNVNICGVMGMATFTDNKEQIRSEFKQLKTYFDKLKSSVFKNCNTFKEVSMGMTGDWEIAIEESSTILRIGTLIFGDRNY